MPSDRHTEQDLVRRANRGDQAALESLYRDHREWVCALAYRFTGSRDQALDILQETYLYFFGKFPGFKLTSSIRGFLYPVVKHQSISLVRRQKRVVSLDAYRQGGAADLEPFWHPTRGPGRHVGELAARLPEKQREVVALRYGLGFRHDEIADALDIPVGTVKSRLHKALNLLRMGLAEGEKTKKCGEE